MDQNDAALVDPLTCGPVGKNAAEPRGGTAGMVNGCEASVAGGHRGHGGKLTRGQGTAESIEYGVWGGAALQVVGRRRAAGGRGVASPRPPT